MLIYQSNDKEKDRWKISGNPLSLSFPVENNKGLNTNI